jgi:hypothetical protein
VRGWPTAAWWRSTASRTAGCPKGSSSSCSAATAWRSAWPRCSTTSGARRSWSAWTPPQVTSELLDAGLAGLANGADAVYGAATDGGYWAIGLARPDASVFDGVPMSERHTGAVQHARLVALGLETHHLPPLRDVDTYEDARSVAAAAPGGRFAAALRDLGARSA